MKIQGTIVLLKVRYFKSTLGGLITLVLSVTIIALCIAKFQVVYHYQASVINMHEYRSDPSIDTEPLVFRENKMALMLSMMSLVRDKNFNEKQYGSWMLLQVYRDEDGSNSNERSGYRSQYIPLSQCNESSPILKDINKQYLSTFELENYLCPDYTNLTLRGRSVSANHYWLYITYNLCTGKDYCVNGTEKDYFLQTMTASIAIGDQWFDQSNYQEPLQSYFSEEYYSLVSDRATLIDYTFKNNTVMLDDSYFGIGSYVKSFPSLSSQPQLRYSSESATGASIVTALNVNIGLSNDQVHYERRIYNLQNMLQDVGGLFTSLFFLGQVFFACFSITLYFTSLIDKAYFISDKIEVNLQQASSSQRKLKDDYSQQIQNQISSLKIIKFSPLQILSLSVKRLCLCQSRKSKGRNKMQAIYENGKQKIMKELDCIEVIKKLRKIDLLYKLHLNKTERALARYQRKYIISPVLKDEPETNSEESIFLQNIEGLLGNLQEKINQKQPAVTRKLLSKLVKRPDKECYNEEFERSRLQICNQIDRGNEQKCLVQPYNVGYKKSAKKNSNSALKRKEKTRKVGLSVMKEEVQKSRSEA